MYLTLGVLWIAFSDRLAAQLFPDPVTYAWVQTFKGWFYVILTAFGLHRLIRYQLDRISEVLEERDIFTAIVSHELNTPLTALNLQISLLERKLKGRLSADEIKASIAQFSETTLRQIQRLNRLVRDLLDVQNIRSGKGLSIRKEDFDLSGLVQECVEEIEPIFKETGSVLKVTSEPGIRLHGDRERIAQVIINLVNNAAKFGEGHPVELSLTRIHSAERDSARLVISDQGIGIAPKDRARIFQAFERAVSSRDFGGLGLGLYISSQIVSAHQGRIRALSGTESDVSPRNAGTDMEVLLPLKSPS